MAIPTACRRRSDTGPIPGSLRTPSGARVAASAPAGMSRTPHGFASPLATFAIGFVAAIPALAGMPSSALIAPVIAATTRTIVASSSRSPASR